MMNYDNVKKDVFGVERGEETYIDIHSFICGEIVTTNNQSIWPAVPVAFPPFSQFIPSPTFSLNSLLIITIYLVGKMLFFVFLLLFISLLICPFHAQNGVEIPRKFFGAFLYDRSDNLEAYLAEKGFDANTRKEFQMPKLTRILYPKEPGIYRMMVGLGLQGSRWVAGSKKNADWTFQLGKEFQAKYWDGNDHLILFAYNPMIDRLLERHIVIGSQAPPEEFVYQINPEGNLDLHVLFHGVELVHHYIRTD